MRLFSTKMQCRSDVCLCIRIICVGLGAAGYSPGDPPKPMPDRYITSGILHLPYAELHEPFSAWVDMKGDISRLDYYNGTGQMGSLLLAITKVNCFVNRFCFGKNKSKGNN